LIPPVAGASKSGRALLTEGVMGVLVSKLKLSGGWPLGCDVLDSKTP